MGRSGGTGGRGAALGHGPSGREREGSSQLYRTGEVIRRWLDGWAASCRIGMRLHGRVPC